MEIYSINKKGYYSWEDLKDCYSNVFGSYDTAMSYIRKHNLDKKYYVFMSRSKGVWTVTNSNKDSHFYLLCQYIDDVYDLNESSDETETDTETEAGSESEAETIEALNSRYTQIILRKDQQIAEKDAALINAMHELAILKKDVEIAALKLMLSSK